jgi:hypothetical protein
MDLSALEANAVDPRYNAGFGGCFSTRFLCDSDVYDV